MLGIPRLNTSLPNLRLLPFPSPNLRVRSHGHLRLCQRLPPPVTDFAGVWRPELCVKLFRHWLGFPLFSFLLRVRTSWDPDLSLRRATLDGGVPQARHRRTAAKTTTTTRTKKKKLPSNPWLHTVHGRASPLSFLIPILPGALYPKERPANARLRLTVRLVMCVLCLVSCVLCLAFAVYQVSIERPMFHLPERE